jgi:SAM-dependent methyltransferase
MTTTQTTPTEEEVGAFLGRFVVDLGSAMAGANVVLGDRLGLYRALAARPGATATDIAGDTGTDARYVHEWLCGQAAGGYVEYDAATATFSMTPAQSACLADTDSPTYVPGAFQLAASLYKDEAVMQDAFRTGTGVGWHEHDADLFEGTERFFRPGYRANLVESWLPALDGVERALLSGATVADVGCGHGASTLIMAAAFPRSTFVGFDYHQASIDQARAAAVTAGMDDRVRFEVAGAADFPGNGYDLVAMFDCLHDMGDPVGAAQHVRASLDDHGTWLIVEPRAADTVEGNLNPVGRVYYSASTLLCVPASRSQEVGLCLGAQAGPARIGAVVHEGGFGSFRTAAETPFNLVYEARP